MTDDVKEVFGSTSQASDQDALNPEDLIGEGKKYPDVASLLKKVANQDLHISTIEEENAGLRAKVTKGFEAISELTNQSKGDTDQNTQTQESSSQAPEPVDVDAAVNKALQKQREIDTAVASRNRALAKFGTQEAMNTAMRDVAAANGLSEDDLLVYAAQNPTLFDNLMGISKQTQQTTNTSPSGDVHPEAVIGDAVKENTFKWYEKMRKEDPTRYWSAKTQSSMHKHAEEMGTTFYS
jgi:hypothetical protein